MKAHLAASAAEGKAAMGASIKAAGARAAQEILVMPKAGEEAAQEILAARATGAAEKAASEVPAMKKDFMQTTASV
jgi:DNA-binding protein YbaB